MRMSGDGVQHGPVEGVAIILDTSPRAPIVQHQLMKPYQMPFERRLGIMYWEQASNLRAFDAILLNIFPQAEAVQQRSAKSVPDLEGRQEMMHWEWNPNL